jgi:NAD(P)-dependent dehydrogenase (short-subunit alcohol dehydrogenase family)
MGQAVIPDTPASIDLTGKTVIVTGANAGLGLEAARQYLTLHASRVILAVRTLAKGEEAARYLSSHPSVKSTNPNAVIEVMALDLDDFQSVVRFSSKVKEKLDVLDVLLLN